jgi:hypothetical protein
MRWATKPAGVSGRPTFSQKAASFDWHSVLDLRSDRYVAIITEESRTAAMRHSIKVMCAQGMSVVWGRRAGAYAGIASIDQDDLRPLIGVLEVVLSGRTGLSPAMNELTEVPNGLRLAELAVHTAPPGANEVVSLDDRLPEALLIKSPELARRLTCPSGRCSICPRSSGESCSTRRLALSAMRYRPGHP